MRLTTMTLRNYRVFETLDLEVPAGLVGIYGPNGAGKSTLLESITWALYGRVRTSKADVRTSGTNGECLVEIGFEHDDHHYLVRRSVSGINSTVKARVLSGTNVVADGPAEVGRYIRSTLGMDEAAFRSSVFAEQKQLAAFSDNTPEQRRRLVLQLLGITPIEKARDAARADVRVRRETHDRLVQVLPVLAALEERLVHARGAHDAANGAAEAANLAARAAEAASVDAERELADQAAAKAAHDVIVAEGRAARAERDRAAAVVSSLESELEELGRDAERLGALGLAEPAELDSLTERSAALERVRRGFRALDALLFAPTSGHERPAGVRTKRRAPAAPEADTADLAALEAALTDARRAHEQSGVDMAGLAAQHAAAKEAAARARAAFETAARLDGTDACTLCGQELGERFHSLREHHQHAHEDADARLRAIEEDVARAKVARDASQRLLTAAEASVAHARRANDDALALRARVAAAQHELDEARRVACVTTDDDIAVAADAVESRRKALVAIASERDRLSGRIERISAAREALSGERVNLARADADRERLRGSLAETGFDPGVHEQRAVAADRCRAQLVAARRVQADAERVLAGAQEAVKHVQAAFEEAQTQHRRVTELSDEVRYLGRAADLLHGFRQAIVASVGPRLSIEAAALFNDLTSGEYDGLEIDPETYEIRIIDGGVAYPSVRFSGSEVDLANLALRVAVSEQVRFQAGGQIGLLVLDEALASLDSDRKDRMLAALTRLSGRFRQILVVTHSPEVKERLPQAIEVFKLGGRRAGARVLDLVH